MPLRCITRLEAAYRTVGQRHRQSVVLVDGPTTLRAKSPRGILDARWFHDNVHPTLAGHVALAEAVLAALKARSAFGWPALTPAPVLDPQQCADEFGISATAWASVCEQSATFYDLLAFLTVDSAERVQWRDRYAQAARQIRAGARPEEVGIAGIGAQRRDAESRCNQLTCTWPGSRAHATDRWSANSAHRLGSTWPMNIDNRTTQASGLRRPYGPAQSRLASQMVLMHRDGGLRVAQRPSPVMSESARKGFRSW